MTPVTNAPTPRAPVSVAKLTAPPMPDHLRHVVIDSMELVSANIRLAQAAEIDQALPHLRRAMLHLEAATDLINLNRLGATAGRMFSSVER